MFETRCEDFPPHTGGYKPKPPTWCVWNGLRARHKFLVWPPMEVGKDQRSFRVAAGLSRWCQRIIQVLSDLIQMCRSFYVTSGVTVLWDRLSRISNRLGRATPNIRSCFLKMWHCKIKYAVVTCLLANETSQGQVCSSHLPTGQWDGVIFDLTCKQGMSEPGKTS